MTNRTSGHVCALRSEGFHPATEAELNRPFEVAVTADGGFLIADTDNNEVRAVSAG